MKGKIRAGVVGGGWPSWQHMKGYKKLDNVELVSLCDANEDRLNTIANEFGVNGRYVSLEKMLENEELDVLSVCTPNFLHAEMAINAMKHGVNVLCEKPMASKLEDAQRMVEVQKATGKVLMIAHQRRFGSEAQYLKKMISNGEFGRIYFTRAWWIRRLGIPGLGGWFTQKSKSGGGALVDIGVHVLDLALWLMNFPEPMDIASSWGSRFGVYGRGSGNYESGRVINSTGFDVDDYAFAHINFSDGNSLQLQCSWAGHIKEDDVNIEIWGEKCGARLYPLQIFSEHNGIPVDSFPKLNESNPFDEEMRVFIESVQNGYCTKCSAEECIKTIELIDKIYKASGRNYSEAETEIKENELV